MQLLFLPASHELSTMPRALYPPSSFIFSTSAFARLRSGSEGKIDNHMIF